MVTTGAGMIPAHLHAYAGEPVGDVHIAPIVSIAGGFDKFDEFDNTGVGNDIEPVSDVETVFTVFAIMTGVVMFAVRALWPT